MYPFPSRQVNVLPKFLYFYITKPTQAIRSKAEVSSFKVHCELSIIDKLKMFKDPTKDASCFVLTNFQEFEGIVKTDSSPNIQAPIKFHSSLIPKCDSISDVFKLRKKHIIL